MPIDVTDPEFAAKLAAAREPDPVVGPDGILLGEFIPRSKMDLFQLDEAKIAEYERMRADPNVKSYTPEEVMARLREIDRCGR
ncbi:MAG: hypothetical protein K2X82_09645 [Gemmataceae bacterium]|nr:hypothetical protein [Gemmataceae bacterium]